MPCLHDATELILVYQKTHWMGPVFGEAMTSFSYAFASELAMSKCIQTFGSSDSYLGINFAQAMLSTVIAPLPLKHLLELS